MSTIFRLAMGFLMCTPFVAFADTLPDLKIGLTRVVYNEGTHQTLVPVTNESQRPFLIKGKIFEADQSGEISNLPIAVPAFLFTPPLVELKASDSQPVKLRAIAHQASQEFESLYWIELTFIPSKNNKNSQSNQISTVLKTQFKLFYRPEKLINPRAMASVVEKLEIKKFDRGVTIYNPTPYWISFASLQINAQEVSSQERQKMIAPLSHTNYIAPLLTRQSNKISYSLIDEYGYDTQKHETSLP